MIVHDRVPRRPSRPLRLGLALAALAALFVSARVVHADPSSAANEGKSSTAAAPAAGANPLAALATDRTAEPTTRAAEEKADAAEAGGGSPFAEGDADAEGSSDAEDSPFSEGNANRRSGGSYRPSPPAGFGNRGSASPFDRRAPAGAMSGMSGMAGGMGGMTGMEAPPISEEVRGKMIASLAAVIGGGHESPDLKAKALESLGRIGRGSSEAEQVLLDAAERVKVDREKLAAAQALNAVGSPRGTQMMWAMLDEATDEKLRDQVVSNLDRSLETPPTVEATGTVARLLARKVQSDVRRGREDTIRGFASALFNGRGIHRAVEAEKRLLLRLRDSDDGIRRIIGTIETTEDPKKPKLVAGSIVTSDGPKSRIEEIYGTETPVRDVLVPLLSGTTPSSDEVALSLVEALSHSDAAIREAAAQALGNAGS